ncbi:MAG: alpha/beta hydrolase [Candidatus Sulfotelmatobacter sp.]
MTASTDILSLPAPKADARVAYGKDENQFLDLWLPQAPAPHAVAIVIHGGYWRAKYDLEYMGHLCAALIPHGIATANLEYRRVGNPGGGWPGTFADVRAAYRFLMQNARQYNLDPERGGVIGHSAGAHLALCLAAYESAIRYVISLAGVVDLQQACALHLSHDAVAEFLGGTPTEVKDHYREADPMRLKIGATQWILHGTIDVDVPPALSRNYVATKMKEKEDARLLEIAGATHFDLVDPRSAAWKDVEKAVIAMAGKHAGRSKM